MTALVLFLAMPLSPAAIMAAKSIPGIAITLDELDLPKTAAASKMMDPPSIEFVKEKQVILIRTRYAAEDKSKASIQLHLIVPGVAAPAQSVPTYFNEVRASRLDCAKQNHLTKVYASSFDKGFDVEYDNRYRHSHFRHVGHSDDTAAYFIDAISIFGKPIDSTVAQLEKAAKSAILNIMLAQRAGPAKADIPGHNLTVPDLLFPEKIGDMKLEGDPVLTHYRNEFATRLHFTYWQWQVQATVIVDLYIPAPGSTDPDTAVKLFWEDYQCELNGTCSKGFKVLVNDRFNNGFTIEKERKEQTERRKITGVLKDRYGYKITLVESGGPVVDYGLSALRQHADNALNLLKNAQGPQLSALKRDQYEPGPEDCYSALFPKLPRANLHVENRSRFRILLQTKGSDINVNGRPISRYPARVTIESKATRIIYHALPVGRAEVSSVPEELQNQTRSSKWSKYINNNALSTCKRMFTLIITDADLTGEAGPKGGWFQEQTSRRAVDHVSPKPHHPDDWESIVE
jgi:hypothetical protein